MFTNVRTYSKYHVEYGEAQRMRRIWTWVARSSQKPLRRPFTSQKSATPTSKSGPIAPAQSSSYQRLVTRTPKFLRPTLSALQNAPVTHITAFLLLHELTAIIPLFGLAGAFHYSQWLPSWFAEGAWVVAGVEKFGRYFKRKGWIGPGEEEEVEREARNGVNAKDIENTRGLKWWNRGEGGTRLVVEFATAYAVVKALLPIRVVLSVWGAPWFARWTVVPVGNAVKRMFGRSSKISPASGTNAVASKKP